MLYDSINGRKTVVDVKVNKNNRGKGRKNVKVLSKKTCKKGGIGLYFSLAGAKGFGLFAEKYC